MIFFMCCSVRHSNPPFANSKLAQHKEATKCLDFCCITLRRGNRQLVRAASVEGEFLGGTESIFCDCLRQVKVLSRGMPIVSYEGGKE